MARSGQALRPSVDRGLRWHLLALAVAAVFVATCSWAAFAVESLPTSSGVHPEKLRSEVGLPGDVVVERRHLLEDNSTNSTTSTPKTGPEKQAKDMGRSGVQGRPHLMNSTGLPGTKGD
eukprot:tig00021532_g22188.t1